MMLQTVEHHIFVVTWTWTWTAAAAAVMVLKYGSVEEERQFVFVSRFI